VQRAFDECGKGGKCRGKGVNGGGDELSKSLRELALAAQGSQLSEVRVLCLENDEYLDVRADKCELPP
jgi:hypothetical protein